jgi:hypothetical protein
MGRCGPVTGTQAKADAFGRQIPGLWRDFVVIPLSIPVRQKNGETALHRPVPEKLTAG